MIYNYCVIAQELPILNQDVKAITLNLYEHMHYPNFLSFSSDLMQSRSWGFFSL